MPLLSAQWMGADACYAIKAAHESDSIDG